MWIEELWRRSTAVLNTYVFSFVTHVTSALLLRTVVCWVVRAGLNAFSLILMEMHIMIYNYMSCLLEDTGRYYYTCYQVKTLKKINKWLLNFISFIIGELSFISVHAVNYISTFMVSHLHIHQRSLILHSIFFSAYCKIQFTIYFKLSFMFISEITCTFLSYIFFSYGFRVIFLHNKFKHFPCFLML